MYFFRLILMSHFLWLNPSALPHPKSGGNNDELDSFFKLAHEILQNHMHPTCSAVVMSSQNVLVPSSAEKILKSNRHPKVFFRFPDDWPPPPEDVNSTVVTPRLLTGCLFFVTMTRSPETIGSLLAWAEEMSHVKRDGDRFLIWSESGKMHDILLSQDTSVIKYKIGVHPNEENKLSLLSTCFFCASGDPSIVPIASFMNGTHLKMEPPRTTLYPDLARNLHGKTIKGIYMYSFSKEPVRKLLQDPKLQEVDQVYVITDACGSAMNYDWQVKESEGGAADMIAGFMNPNSPGPIVKAVQKGEASFCPAMLLTAAMISNSELGTIIDSDYLAFLVGRPRRFFSWTTIVEPFSLILWLTLLIFLCIGSMSLAMLLSAAIGQNISQKPFYARFSHALTFAASALLERGIPLPAFVPVRVFAAFWWVLAIVFATIYKSRLFSCLTFPPLEVLPTTASEFLEANYKVIATYDHITFFNILTMDKLDPLTVEFKQKIAPADTLEDCVRTIVKERAAACLSVPIVLSPLQQSFLDIHGHSCTRLVRDSNYGFYAYVPTQKESTWTAAFAHTILRYLESEIIQRWNQHNIQRRRLLELHHLGGISCKSEEERSPLTFLQLCGPFILLMLGCSFSLVIFMLELVVALVASKKVVRPVIIAPYPFLR